MTRNTALPGLHLHPHDQALVQSKPHTASCHMALLGPPHHHPPHAAMCTSTGSRSRPCMAAGEGRLPLLHS
jgi:hypothetical protein